MRPHGGGDKASFLIRTEQEQRSADPFDLEAKCKASSSEPLAVLGHREVGPGNSIGARRVGQRVMVALSTIVVQHPTGNQLGAAGTPRPTMQYLPSLRNWTECSYDNANGATENCSSQAQFDATDRKVTLVQSFADVLPDRW